MEIPLEMELKRSYSRKPDADEAELEAQVTRLLVMKNKKGKEFYAYMHIMAESGYLAECGYKLHGNRYKNIQDGFTGHIYYTRPDGGYNNGWTYANGRITGKLAKLGNGSGDASALAKNQVRDMICITYTWVEWEQHCVVTYPSGNVSCGPWHIVSQFVLWEECYGSGNDDSGGGYDNDDDGDDDNTDKEKPCGMRKTIKADSTFNDKLKDFMKKANNDSITVEHGYMKRANGTYQTPTTLHAKKLTYGSGGVSGKYTERMHTHPGIHGGAPYFSAEDVSVMYNMYNNGHMDDPLTFRYGIASPFGCYMLQITDENKFKAFASAYNLKNTHEKLKKDMESTDEVLLRGSPTAITQSFLKFITGKDAGLSMIEGKMDINDAETDSSIEIDWNVKTIVNGEMKSNNCDD